MDRDIARFLFYVFVGGVLLFLAARWYFNEYLFF
jgi:hypothetical protein